jgi:large subunit ribosomal protein L27
VLVGRTHSIHAAVDGHVKFERKAEGRVHVSVEPVALAAE